MSDFCLQHGIGILPYGVLAGGFLSDKYLGVPSSKWVLVSKQNAMSSASIALDNLQVEWLSCCRVKVNTYSLSKYSSMISLNGGWDWFQNLLQVCGQLVQSQI